MPLKELLKNYHIKTGVDKLEDLPSESAMLRKEKKRLKILNIEILIKQFWNGGMI